MGILFYVILYFVIVIVVYLLLAMIIQTNIGNDPEFDDAMSDGSARMFALTFISLFWFITIPIILIYNIFN